MNPKMIEPYSNVLSEAKRKAAGAFDGVKFETDSPQNPPQSPMGENRNKPSKNGGQ